MAEIGVGLAMGLGVLGVGLGLGILGHGMNEGIARNPEMASKIFQNTVVIAAFAEGIAIVNIIFAVFLMR